MTPYSPIAVGKSVFEDDRQLIGQCGVRGCPVPNIRQLSDANESSMCRHSGRTDLSPVLHRHESSWRLATTNRCAYPKGFRNIQKPLPVAVARMLNFVWPRGRSSFPMPRASADGLESHVAADEFVAGEENATGVQSCHRQGSGQIVIFRPVLSVRLHLRAC
jgi:hypothetical protein